MCETCPYYKVKSGHFRKTCCYNEIMPTLQEVIDEIPVEKCLELRMGDNPMGFDEREFAYLMAVGAGLKPFKVEDEPVVI